MNQLFRGKITVNIGSRKYDISFLDSRNDFTPVLLIHGFASYSRGFERLIRKMPQNFRFISPDLKGFGYSDKSKPEEGNLYLHTEIIYEFVKMMNLEHFVLVGHSTGGAVAVLANAREDFRRKVDQLILIDSAGMQQEPPLFVRQLAAESEINPVLRHSDKKISTYIILEHIFHNPMRISDKIINLYAKALAQPGAAEGVVAAAQNFALVDIKAFQSILRTIKCPTLIIWGENDNIIPLEEAFSIHRMIPDSKLRIIKECGHAPHEEQPQESAAVITAFLGHGSFNDASIPDNNKTVAEIPYPGPQQENSHDTSGSQPTGSDMKNKHRQHLKMSRLIDNWNPGTIILFGCIKFLQLLKLIGFKAEENGWRAASGIFLRNEYSKFMLGSFRLKYFHSITPPQDEYEAKSILINRLSDFLSRQSDYLWSVEPGFMKMKRKKVFFTDIVEATYDSQNNMTAITPYFDPRQNSFNALSPDMMQIALHRMVREYNALLSSSERVRPQELLWRLKFWARRNSNASPSARLELKLMFERILSATFINFQFDSDESLRKRLRTPEIRKRPHPGWGLLNIFCNFTGDFSEVDLWFQYHHVPVDGVPMQEILEKLKNEWGSAGQILYPAIHSPAARPEIMYCGERIFRARIFADFQPLLQLRYYLNKQYSAQMGGQATIAGMIIWGMAQHEYFRENKFLVPVDLSSANQEGREREISLAFIRPANYFYPDRPLESFILFQKELNSRVSNTRVGRGESYELLELYSLMHPVFYYIARYLMPKSVGEIVGTMGLSIIRSAELFVSPLSDLQSDGFMTIGKLNMPTEDGKTAGAVSICSAKEKIPYYIQAINDLTQHYHQFLALPENIYRD